MRAFSHKKRQICFITTLKFTNFYSEITGVWSKEDGGGWVMWPKGLLSWLLPDEGSSMGTWNYMKGETNEIIISFLKIKRFV